MRGKKGMNKVSIIIPVWNEEKNITPLVERIHTSCKEKEQPYEIIIVDDHSTDKTRVKISKLLRKYPIVSLLKQGKRGKAYSLFEGMQKASSPFIVCIDADLQYPPEAIIPMIQKLKEGSDIVVANRVNQQISPLRKFISTSFKKLFGKTLFGLDYDIQAGLKVFRREIISLLDYQPSSGWTFDLEFLHRAKQAGLAIENFDITFEKRLSGKSKVSFLATSVEIGINALQVKSKQIKPVYIPPTDNKTMRGAGIGYRKRKYITHTTLNHTNSAITSFTTRQKMYAAFIVGIFVLGIFTHALVTLQILIGILSFIYLADVLFHFFLILKSLRYPQEITICKKEIKALSKKSLPIYSILCPLYKEVHVISQFLKAINTLDYPKDKLDVMLLLEEDDIQSKEKIKNLKLPYYVRTIIVPHSLPKTKPKACNFGLSYAKGKYLVIYDAEDIPDAFQLKKALIGFEKAGKTVACLQAKLNYYNPHQNLLTKFFTAEYSLWFDVTLPGLQAAQTSIPLGGTSNHFRTEDLKRLKGWDPFNVTEDADLGIRLFKKGFTTAIIDSVTLEEANSNIKNWIRQRSRWIKGYMQTYLVHTRQAFGMKNKNLWHSLFFQLTIGGKIAFILINPILWIATISYFAFYQVVGSTIALFYPTTIFYVAAFSLVVGNFLFLYYYMVGCAKREEWGLIKYIYFVPFYWMLISWAGFIALYQLLFKPHYWEKTVHGLHLSYRKQQFRLYGFPNTISIPLNPQAFGIQILQKTGKKTIQLFFELIQIIELNIFSVIDLFHTFPKNQTITGTNLNILIFNWRDTRHNWAGGAEEYIHQLAKRWVVNGNKVTLFCGNDGVHTKNEIIDGIQIIRRGGFYTVYLWAFFYYVFHFKGSFDVVIDSENGIPFFTPLFVAEPIFLLIHHVHQEIFRTHLFPPFSYIALFLEGKLMPFIYKNITVITVSESSKMETLRLGFTDKNKIIVISPGLDSTIFKPSKKTIYPSLLYLGRLKPYKNIQTAIHAFSLIATQFPKAKFLIAGEGESRGKLSRLVHSLNLSKKIKFTGQVSNEQKRKLYAQSWLCIQPSLIEGWGITVIEANASGTPVVASNVNGLKDSIQHKKTGFLVRPHKPSDFSQTISYCFQHKTILKKLEKEAHIWSQNFSWDRSSQNFYEELYQRVQLSKVQQHAYANAT